MVEQRRERGCSDSRLPDQPALIRCPILALRNRAAQQRLQPRIRDRRCHLAHLLGAAAAVHGLRGRGVRVMIANRTLPHAEELADRFAASAHPMTAVSDLLQRAGLLVNTTSLGMAGKPPLQLDLLGLQPGAVVYDIVYVPLETPLLAEARARGHRAVDGLGMLLHQAVPGFAHWFGVTPRVTPELRALLEADLRR